MAIFANHRSRLTKATAASRLASLEGEVAKFSDLSQARFGSGGVYHAAQTNRLREFSGDTLLGRRPNTEEEMLRPYDRARIISRARIMVRNNPWFAALLLAYVQEVGTPTYKSTAVLETEDATKAYNNARENLIHRWARDCESDNDLSLEEVIEIKNFEDCIAGEIFIVTLKTAELQLVPSELCGSETNGPVPAGAKFMDGTPIPAGTIEKWGILRANGKRVGYRFAKRDPETGAVDFTPEKTVVVAARYVIHRYNPDRVEQGRGVPLCAAFLTKAQDIFETGDARAQQVKNAACLSLWVTKNIDPYGFAEAMRGAMRTGSIADPATLKSIADASTRSQYQDIRAGAVYYGATGETAQLIEPKLSSGDWHEHYIDLLQVCCACLNGMPVEVGLEGFRNSSYSSSRGTMNKWKRNVGRIRTRDELKILDPFNLLLTNRAELFRDLDPIPADQKAECRWGWPAIPDIDGLKTSLQNAADLAIGATNLRKIYAEKGEHYDIEIKQGVREKIEILQALIKGAESLGYTPDQARSIALTQMPSADGRALAALITATGAFTEDTAAAKKPAPKE